MDIQATPESRTMQISFSNAELTAAGQLENYNAAEAARDAYGMVQALARLAEFNKAKAEEQNKTQAGPTKVETSDGPVPIEERPSVGEKEDAKG